MGTIVKKATKMDLTCFVNADFAGLFKRDPDHSITSAKSCTGYIIKLAECPLIWKSQLQPIISLSTAESEYYALSQAIHVRLPLRGIANDLLYQVSFPSSLSTLKNNLQATVKEDNTSALSLATEQRLTSRTRHYHIRWHFFWQSINDGKVEVIYVATKDQDADYLTKGLTCELFEHCHELNQGW